MALLQWLNLGVNKIDNISPLSGLINLSEIYLFQNQISDISSLAGLTNISQLGLDNNLISDITPLIINQGINSGDTITLNWNPLSYISCTESIAELISRGVNVIYDSSCPSIDPYVSSDSGRWEDNILQNGVGFWPGGKAELHFVYKQTMQEDLPVIIKDVDSAGRFYHSYLIPSGKPTGTWIFWAKDITTQIESPKVEYLIMP